MKEGRAPGRPNATIVAGINTDGRQPVPPCVASHETFVATSYILVTYEGGSGSWSTECNDRNGFQHGRAAARPSWCISRKLGRDVRWLGLFPQNLLHLGADLVR
jgi:hypothetical protein